MLQFIENSGTLNSCLKLSLPVLWSHRLAGKVPDRPVSHGEREREQCAVLMMTKPLAVNVGQMMICDGKQYHRPVMASFAS